MARLTADEWERVRADYEVRSMSFNELSKKYGIGKSTISKRVNSEGWIKGKSEPLVDKKVNIINGLIEVSKESEPLGEPHKTAIDQEVAFILENNKDLQRIQRKVNAMVELAENPNHVLALMNATVRHREARVGKNPEVAIQVNNQVQVINPFAEDAD